MRMLQNIPQRDRRQLIIIYGLALIVGLFTIWFVMDTMHAAKAAAIDKTDTECAGTETAGRCADKCPEGYHLMGFDKETGAAVCKAPPTGCPYADSVPLGEECDKLAPAENVYNEAQATVPADQSAEPFAGK